MQSWEKRIRFKEFLVKHHQAFCLETGERGATDLVQMEINTLDIAQEGNQCNGCPTPPNNCKTCKQQV